MSNNKPKRNYHLTTRLGQFIYLSISNFTTNNLWESASACSFGFVFSFIPITLIIIVSLVTILQNFPGVLNSVLQFVTQFEDIIDVKPYIKNIAAYRSLHVVDIFLAIWIRCITDFYLIYV